MFDVETDAFQNLGEGECHDMVYGWVSRPEELVGFPKWVTSRCPQLETNGNHKNLGKKVFCY